jgi:hypothetical protein
VGPAAAPVPAGTFVEGSVHPTNLAIYNDANENRSLTAGLGATCIAVLTFVLIFLYDRAASGQVNDLLFQGTLLVIVVSLSLISLSSLNYWFVMEALRNRPPRAKVYQQRADGLFAASLVLLLLEPALILVTVRLYVLGAVAVGFWIAGFAVLAWGWRELR